MAREHLSRNDEERRRRLELSRYSHNLSSKILSFEGKSSIGPEIPDPVLMSFQRGSIMDRDAYWQEHAQKKNFGQQMIEWVGIGEKPGMANWVEKQKDPTVLSMLQEVGLKSTSNEQTNSDLRHHSVMKLLTVINKDLQKAGKGTFLLEDLSEEQARSIIFYSRFLSGERKQEEAKELIDTLVKVASSESNGNINGTVANLQKVEPLFRVTGEEGRKALGALTMAKAHATDDINTLQKVTPDAVLNADEANVLKFLKANREYEEPEPLELGKPENIERVLKDLEPEPTPGHPYWVENIPADFAKALSVDQLRSLESPKTFWKKGEKGTILNRDAFDPAYALRDDGRFYNAETLTENDSGLFALAAASAETPEKQAQLYHTLGEIVLRVHKENPALLENFLKVQTPESAIEFGENDRVRSGKDIDQNTTAMNAALKRAFEKKFNMPYNLQVAGTAEQQAFLREAQAPFANNEHRILHSFSDNPERLVALDLFLLNENVIDQIIVAIPNIAETVPVWPERIKELQKVLEHRPLTLTPEQIRQIEFLSHSVDSVKIIHMLQGKQEGITPHQEAVQPIESSAPLDTNSARRDGSMEDNGGQRVAQESLAQLMENEGMVLADFFEALDRDAQDLLPKTTLPRRKDFGVEGALAQFSTYGEDVSRFEITTENADGVKELALYTIVPRADGTMRVEYNIKAPFFDKLFEVDSMSDNIFWDELANGNKSFEQNTLLAYVVEAGDTPQRQQELFTKLFLQIASLYQDHDDTRTSIATYFRQINQEKPFIEDAKIERLFSSAEVMSKRLQELTIKLNENQQFTLQDFQDMGLYAVPFNLQYIAGRMKEAYAAHAATDTPLSSNQSNQ